MDIKKIFNPLQRIYFIQEDSATDKANSQLYYSRIEEVSHSEITVIEPYGQGFYLPRNYQQVYKGRVIFDNCAYLFKTRLIRYIEGFVPLWVVAMPEEIQRNQLRNFVRLPIHVEATIVLLTEGNEGEPISTITRNISGSGVGVVLKEPLPLGSKVKVVLPLDYDVVEAEGEVVRVVAPEPTYDKHAVGINFTNIQESARKIIIRYIFRKQVARRKKEAELFE